MAITASDIHNQSFSIDRKGYDVDEVDEFLEYVANEIDNLNNTIASLEEEVDQDAPELAGFDTIAMDAVANESVDIDISETPASPADLAAKDARIAELERQLAEKKANDNAISQALIIAQRAGDEAIAKANETADQIVADAREEAAHIIAEANAEKAEIEEEIAKLDGDCETIRERFQGILKDFIGDASDKLAEISDASIMASAHARANRLAARNYETPALPVRESASAVSEYSTPMFTRNEVVAAPAVPASFIGEKDLSGFGDAVDNDFDFDELD